MPETKTWFSFNHDDGFALHDTEEAARKAAQDALDLERAISDKRWWDEVHCICWGRLLGHVVETQRLEVPEGVTVDEDKRGSDGVDYSDIPAGCDSMLDYALVDLRSAAREVYDA